MKRAPRRMTMQMIMKQYSSMSKASLVRKIMKALKKLPKAKLAKLCFELEKQMLPTISTTKKGMPRLTARRAYKKPRSAKQRANDKRLGRMAKARAKAKRKRRRR